MQPETAPWTTFRRIFKLERLMRAIQASSLGFCDSGVQGATAALPTCWLMLVQESIHKAKELNQRGSMDL